MQNLGPKKLPGLGLVAAFLLTACGGGGGGTSGGPTPVPAPPGIAGTILQADMDLGLVAEQEPNDARAQPHRLPPLAAGSRLAVTGEVGVTSARFGREDRGDAFALQVLARQDVALRLGYDRDDPIQGGDNELRVDVYEDAGAQPIASTVPGLPPLTTAFVASSRSVYQIVVTATAGHGAYTVTLDLGDPSGSSLEEAPPVVALTSASERRAPQRPQVSADTHLLVRLRPGTDDADLVARRLGLRLGRRLASGALRLEFPERLGPDRASRLEAWCKRLLDDPDVESAEPDYWVQPLGLPNDPELARQWNLRAVGAPAAWEVTRGDSSVIVGILDSGIIDHPDLEGQVVGGYDFISDPSISGDGDGRDPDPTDVGALEDPSGLSWWHGTHVAAIVAARADDDYGICGVAPGCRVMPLRAVGRGGGLVSDVVDAILYAAGLHTTEDGSRLSQPLPILNLSFGLDVDSTELRLACERARTVGVFLVGATGNTGLGVLYPARYDSVFAVAAVDARLNTQSYSSFGEEVDISAPGGTMAADAGAAGWPNSILSCQRDETTYPSAPGHGYMAGTSQAAPHVAGVAALLFSVEPDLTLRDLETYLKGSALDRGLPGHDEAYGWGVVQAAGALNLLLLDLGTPWTAPPALGLVSFTDAFPGFDTEHRIPAFNVGAGKLDFSEEAFPVATDDGGDWLEARIDPGSISGSRTNAKAIVIGVSRSKLPSAAGAYAGTVFVDDIEGKRLGTIRVVAYQGTRLVAGQNLFVRCWQGGGASIPAHGVASAAYGYRYWFPSLPSGDFQIEAGQDLDGDGFFCEAGDACGWYGGPTEAEAETIRREVRDTHRGIDVILR